MMFFFIRQDPLEQVPCYIIMFFSCNVNDLPVQLNGPSFLFPVIFQHIFYGLADGDGIRLCCRLSPKKNDSLRDGFSMPHLSNGGFPQTWTREPERRMARYELALLSGRRFISDCRPVAGPNRMLQHILYRNLQFSCYRLIQ
jgi:hypothetical protein